MKKRVKEKPIKKISLKDTLKEWLQMNPEEIPNPRNNTEMIVKGMIQEARNGDSQAFRTINSLLNDGQGSETPHIEIDIVDNSRLERFLYMTDEERDKWQEEHKDQKEYKITCVSEEAVKKLEEEFPQKKIEVGDL